MSIGLLFPGQGAQSVGMGRGLSGLSQLAKDRFATASDILGLDLLEMCLSGPAENLNQTHHSQPALFVHSFVALELLIEKRPDLWQSVTAVAGLSLGEYTAIAAAGGLSFEDGLRLVRSRGLAMQAAADATRSGMSSILGLDDSQVASVCIQATVGPDSFVTPANLLCPGNIAISGHLDALERAEEMAAGAGAMRTVRLPVAGAFHTPLMKPAIAPLATAMDKASFLPLRVPVYSNVDAAPHVQPAELRSLLAEQLVAPVQWEKTIRELLACGTEQFIEVGTGRVLTGTIKRISRKTPCENFGDSL